MREDSAMASEVCLCLGQSVLETVYLPQLHTMHVGEQGGSEAAQELQAHVLSCRLRADLFSTSLTQGKVQASALETNLGLQLCSAFP